MMRLDAMLSRFGCCTRREAGSLVRAGRVTVCGAPAGDASAKARPADVLVDGVPLPFPDGLLVAFHKPTGVTCSHDPAEGELIYDLLPADWVRRDPRVESVGRLDKDTSGLILLTDDGALLHRLTSPRHHVEKEYEVTTDSPLPPDLAEVFGTGTLMLRGDKDPCLPARLEPTGPVSARIIITEGRYHQVRRMFASQGCRVVALHRTRVGGIILGDLTTGQWREIDRSAL